MSWHGPIRAMAGLHGRCCSSAGSCSWARPRLLESLVAVVGLGVPQDSLFFGRVPGGRGKMRRPEPSLRCNSNKDNHRRNSNTSTAMTISRSNSNSDNESDSDHNNYNPVATQQQQQRQ